MQGVGGGREEFWWGVLGGGGVCRCKADQRFKLIFENYSVKGCYGVSRFSV